MTSIPDKIWAEILGQSVDLVRYEAGLNATMQAMITQLGNDLARDLSGAGLDTPRTDWQRARLRSMLEEAQKTIETAYTDMGAVHADELEGLVQVAGKGITTAMNEAIGAKLMVPPKWTQEQIRTIASDVLIQGAPSAAWWDRQAVDLTQAFSDTMRQGMLRGETITQLRDRILGQDLPGVGAVGKVDLRTIPKAERGVIKAARRNAEALVRTSVVSTANMVHLEAFKANADIMEGVQWMSTLDNRTTLVCRALDGLKWTLEGEPIGHSHPYPGATAHWNCRSTTTPVTKSWETLAREAGGDTRLARELDKIPTGQRASMGGPVSGDLNYEGWFAKQSEKRQLEILGPGKFELWQKGKLGFTDMVDQRGNPLNLEQLSEKAGANGPSVLVSSEAFGKWYADPKGYFPMFTIPSEVRDAISGSTSQSLLSKWTLDKQLDHHPELTVADYVKNIGLFETPNLAVQEIKNQNVAHLISLDGDGNPWVAVVKAARSGGMETFLTSFRRTDPRDIGNIIERGRVLFGSRPK